MIAESNPTITAPTSGSWSTLTPGPSLITFPASAGPPIWGMLSKSSSCPIPSWPIIYAFLPGGNGFCSKYAAAAKLLENIS